jgi:hypothetical protein
LTLCKNDSQYKMNSTPCLQLCIASVETTRDISGEQNRTDNPESEMKCCQEQTRGSRSVKAALRTCSETNSPAIAYLFECCHGARRGPGLGRSFKTIQSFKKNPPSKTFNIVCKNFLRKRVGYGSYWNTLTFLAHEFQEVQSGPGPGHGPPGP